MTNKLTPKQEAFAQKDIEYGNGTKAYEEVYDASGMTNGAVRAEVCKLRGHPNISQRQDEIRDELAERNAVTLDSLSEELDGAIKMAKDLEQPSPAVTGIMGKAKLHGFITDKQKVDGDSTVNVILKTYGADD